MAAGVVDEEAEAVPGEPDGEAREGHRPEIRRWLWLWLGCVHGVFDEEGEELGGAGETADGEGTENTDRADKL